MENVANKKNMPDGVETIEDLVRHSLDQDYNKANIVFGDLMSDKLNTVLDQAKMKIAGNIYNGDPEEEDDGLPSDVEPETEDEEEGQEHTHDDGTTHSHPGGDEEHTHDDEEDEEEPEDEVEGAAV